MKPLQLSALNYTVPPPSLGYQPIKNISAAYMVIPADNGTVINCTSGTFTISLPPATTLGAGFNCWIWNTSTNQGAIITIDPNGTETIDRYSTIALQTREGVQIVCDGTNWITSAGKELQYYSENTMDAGIARPSATGGYSVAIGGGATASGNYAFAIGANSAGSGSQTASGNGVMALGGSYASGADSFAAALGTNSSSYGATGPSSIVIGSFGKATSTGSVCIGFATASGQDSFAVAGAGTVGTTASGNGAYALGGSAISNLTGKYVYASGALQQVGDAQTGVMVLRRSTTDATPTVLTSNGSAAGAANQIILPNNSTFSFRIQVVCMQQAAGGTGAAGYTFTGVIRRGANAASTTLLASSKTIDWETDTTWDCAVSADTTNGGLAVTATGAAATNIRWVATCWTSEVTYA